MKVRSYLFTEMASLCPEMKQYLNTKVENTIHKVVETAIAWAETQNLEFIQICLIPSGASCLVFKEKKQSWHKRLFKWIKQRFNK